jgi:altronate hydrolase
MDSIKINKDDTVAIALVPLKKDSLIDVDGDAVRLLDDIPKAHKFALRDIAAGEQVVKYGNFIGAATQAIRKGQWVHDHNVGSGAGEGYRKEYVYSFDSGRAILPGSSGDTFPGYERKDGSAGIRNYLAVIPTVSCVNGPLQRIAALASERYKKSKNFDGIMPLPHPYGCSQAGQDLETTGKIIAGLIRNANFGGVLVVSLGCEVNNLDQLKKYMGEYDPARVKFLVLQDCEDEFETGLALCDEIYEKIARDQRKPVNLSKLHVALNCGGSDGFSGITANALAGSLAEKLVSKGATVSMTEVPEMFGAEHILMNRAVSREVFEDIVKMIRDYAAYFAKHGEDVNGNATQGNKAGGLSTIEEKSLGCIQKGGNCAVTEAIGYGERVSKNGLALISGPGNDLPGITGQIAAGAVLTVFTTGRGTPCGFAGPTFRLSSNTALAEKKPGWIDFDAGRIADMPEEKDRAALREELYDKVMETVNGGYYTRNEKNGYYQIGILKDGVTL